jgi:hypothetical protein
MNALWLLNTWLDNPAWSDRHFSRAERAVALAPLAAALVDVSRSPRELAILDTIARRESGLASLVVRGGDCSKMPRGQRCDNGAARGFGQLHAEACRSAYAFPAGSEESIRAEAQCAIGLIRTYEARCGTLAGAFSMYGTGGRCGWSGGAERARSAERRAREFEAMARQDARAELAAAEAR